MSAGQLDNPDNPKTSLISSQPKPSECVVCEQVYLGANDSLHYARLAQLLETRFNRIRYYCGDYFLLTICLIFCIITQHTKKAKRGRARGWEC